MATYEELFALIPNSELANKVTVAVIVAAAAIRSEEPPVAARVAWAASAMTNPAQEAKRMLPAVLAANKDIAVTQITGASDAAIQAQVDAAVSLFTGV